MITNNFAQKKLADICELIGDGTHFSPQSTDGPYKYITSKNIRFGRLDLSDLSYISNEDHKSIYKSCPVQKGDILLTKDGANTGNACINELDEEFSLLSSVAYLRVDDEKADPEYVLQYLLSSKGQWTIKNMMSGQAITRLTLKKINNITIDLPELNEQKKIAKILSTWDDAIVLTESLIKYKEQRKQALIQKLIDKTNLIKLSRVVDISIGGTPARKQPAYWDAEKTTNNVWISISDMSDNKKYISESKEYISDLGISKSNVKLVDSNTVIMSFKLTIGRRSITTKPLYTNEAIAALIPKEKKELDVEYLYYALSVVDFYKHVDRAAKGKTLNKSKLANLELPLMKLEEQRRVVSVLSLADEEIYLERKKLDLLRKQKRGLMQRFLTDKVRVN